MPNEIRIDSTTDSLDEVRAAAGLPPAEPAVPAAPAAATPETPAETPPAGSPPATPAATPTQPADADAEDEGDEGDDEPVSQEAATAAAKTLNKRRSRAKERIEELSRELYHEQRERQRLERELKTRAEPPAPAPAATPPAAPPPAVPETPSTPASAELAALGAEKPEPKEADFEDFNQYVKELTKWTSENTVRRALVVRAAEEAKRETERSEREVFDRRKSAIETRLKAAREQHPDFDAALQKNGAIETPQYMTEYLQDSEAGMEVLYFLATHPEEAEKISRLPPARCIAALGRLEGKFEEGRLFGGPADDAPPATAPGAPAAAPPPARAAAPPVPIPVGSAPPPAPRVGQSGARTAKTPDQMTDDELAALPAEEFRAWRDSKKRGVATR